MKEAATKKLFVMGIDGMDPRLTKKYLAEGVMPNTQKLIDQGAQREDLVLLGAHPTITPPMWTTLATGAYPYTHGITCFNRQGSDLDKTTYNLDSRLCQAEQIWNVTAEANLKTLVFHWPGSSWPPSSESPNLHVVDGVQPATVNSNALVDFEFIMVAGKETEEVIYKEKMATDSNVPCVINDVAEVVAFDIHGRYATTEMHNIIFDNTDGEHGYSEAPFDLGFSPIKPATGWLNAPEGALEFTLPMSKGKLRRMGLVLKNTAGVYDQIAIYKSKKETEPIVVLEKDVYVHDIVDEAISDWNDEKQAVARSMRVLELKEDGSYLRMWISQGIGLYNDDLWSPKYLYQKVLDHCGHPLPFCMVGGMNKELLEKCMLPNWDATAQWYANAINFLIEDEHYDVVLSHFHNVDLEGHMLIQYLKGNERISESEYGDLLRQIYIQTDKYIGKYLHLLAKGWTILIVSDHGQVCPEHGCRFIGDNAGVNLRIMQELGYTNVKLDAEGHELREIDWEKTTAVAIRANHIYINLRGRDPHGIVDPAEQYELEEQLMTDLYGYKDPETGKRIISLAVRNKDAVFFGLGGPECGDIIYFTAEGYNYDHGDALSTTYGYGDTSVSPIFIAAGQGIKKGHTTSRVIREVDVAPTMAALLGVRMPHECEGAPAYQIFAQVY